MNYNIKCMVVCVCCLPVVWPKGEGQRERAKGRGQEIHDLPATLAAVPASQS